MSTSVNERGLTAYPWEVRAILDGRKTQTRRVVKPQPADYYEKLCGPEYYEPTIVGRDGEEREGPPIFGAYSEDGEYGVKCPYEVGQWLWVRETWAKWTDGEAPECCVYRADDEPTDENFGPWKSPIHMPRWASRITLEITDVRVERVADISLDDCLAEGIVWTDAWRSCRGDTIVANPDVSPDESISEGWEQFTKEAFRDLWQSINGKKPGCSWADNPFCWAISFRRISDAS